MRLFALPIRDLETGRTPGHPELQPLSVPAPPERVFSAVTAVAGRERTWTVVKLDRDGGTLSAEARSLVWGFVDDVMVRVEADGSGTVVNVRTRSRTGNLATGSGVKRIRRFLARVARELSAQLAGNAA